MYPKLDHKLVPAIIRGKAFVQSIDQFVGVDKIVRMQKVANFSTVGRKLSQVGTTMSRCAVILGRTDIIVINDFSGHRIGMVELCTPPTKLLEVGNS